MEYETKVSAAVVEDTKVELSVEVCFMEDHERGFIDENRLVEHQIFVLEVDNEDCKARESTDKKAVNDAKMELMHVEEAIVLMRNSCQLLSS